MNKTHLTAVVTTALIAISGVGAASAQATTHFPLSPASQPSAERKAEQYLRMGGYSRQGLIEQLEYEKFTPAKAEYGAAAVGL
jgi:hypothetical protein